MCFHRADELPAGSLGSDWSLRRPPPGPRTSLQGRRRSGISFESLSSAGEGPPSQRSSLENMSRVSFDLGPRSSLDQSRSSLEMAPGPPVEGRPSTDAAGLTLQVGLGLLVLRALSLALSVFSCAEMHYRYRPCLCCTPALCCACLITLSRLL